MIAIPEGTIIGPVSEVHIVEILDGYRIEVAIPSISKPGDVTYAMISIETERYVNDIHDHKEELRSSNQSLTELQGSIKSDPYEERKGSSINKETCANPFSNPPQRKCKIIHAHSPDGGYSATAVSKMVTKILRHDDQEERQTDSSRHWDTIRPTLVKAFAREEARDFDDGYWLMLRIEYCEDNNGSVCHLRARIDELFAYSLHWKEHIYHRRISWNFQSILGSGLIPGRQENDRARQSVFCTALNPFGQDTEEEPVVLISTQGHVEEQLANTAAATTAAAAAWEQRATWESRTRVRDDTKHAMEVERASRKLVLATSEAEADAHLTGRKTLTNTDTKEIERIKIGSNKICIREDLAKEKRVFSKETSHAISAMGSVNHRFNAHHAFTTFLKAHFFAIAVSY